MTTEFIWVDAKGNPVLCSECGEPAVRVVPRDLSVRWDVPLMFRNVCRRHETLYQLIASVPVFYGAQTPVLGHFEGSVADSVADHSSEEGSEP